MCDSKRRYKGIREALNRIYPSVPTGAIARHLNVLAAMIGGIVGCRSTNLPNISRRCSLEALPESRVKRFSRWLKNDSVELETYFMPFACALIRSLSPNGVVLVVDGSVVGRGCIALVVGVVYRQRALPIGWTVARGQKGHFPQTTHIVFIKRVREIIPQGVRVTLLGDGEFDGVNLQSLVSQWN